MPCGSPSLQVKQGTGAAAPEGVRDVFQGGWERGSVPVGAVLAPPSLLFSKQPPLRGAGPSALFPATITRQDKEPALHTPCLLLANMLYFKQRQSCTHLFPRIAQRDA